MLLLLIYFNLASFLPRKAKFTCHHSLQNCHSLNRFAHGEDDGHFAAELILCWLLNGQNALTRRVQESAESLAYWAACHF